MKCNRNFFTGKLRINKGAVRRLQNTRFCVVFLLSVIIAAMLILPYALSSLMNRVILGSRGHISFSGVAESGSAEDIQAAVDWVVSRGGIGDVYIPEGTFNFVEVGEPWKTVYVPAGVNLFGAPTERDVNDQVIQWKTVIVMPSDVPDSTWFKFDGNSDPNKPSRFSDIKLVGYRDINPDSTSMHCPVWIQSVIDFRIDHCFFKHTTLGIKVFGIYCCGVIDHCKLINEYGIGVPYETRTIDYGVQVSREWENTLWEDDITKVLGKYTNYTVFIEDCHFSKWRHCIASHNSAHYVFRHNIIEDDFGYGSIDAHGTYTNVGTRAVEAYNNTFLNPSPWKEAIRIRGGGGVFFNNSVVGYTQFVTLTNEGTVEKCYPKNIYVWNNNLPMGVAPVSPNGQTEGVEYFLYAMPDYQHYKYPHPLTLS